MKIALIGASGNVGSRIVDEALRRGHNVVAIARNAGQLAQRTGVTVVAADVKDAAGLASAIKGADVVVSSGRFTSFGAADLLPAVKAAGVKRLAIVGGAGSLEIAPGKALIDTPEFPEEYKPEASGGRDFLNALRGEQELEWTFLSPSALFIAGERTGQFRLGQDQLLVGADGKSWISYEDFAVALLDELEQPKHVRTRFTVGY
ncbi:NAD(P)-dependent oxidoreductase [Herbaspirillum sp. AP02]|uniref:NAD(P)-dependent oxidoreductase n=1 Tax=unclassified Herbaspirillum TaxID=2624150 RepID=UPI0015D9E987|nr:MULTISPECIES: NAD(P)-dependent oxidoreductase [unclassified Herbaspirillum]MBG7621713.1 NAD(P)-dependent oxidoreductase [Herbaspirillum sp. AP02]NZD67093.1 NAD(P)-dependent oxidoreductase [Herbaspirillum sp. AP21]